MWYAVIIHVLYLFDTSRLLIGYIFTSLNLWTWVTSSRIIRVSWIFCAVYAIGMDIAKRHRKFIFRAVRSPPKIQFARKMAPLAPYPIPMVARTVWWILSASLTIWWEDFLTPFQWLGHHSLMNHRRPFKTKYSCFTCNIWQYQQPRQAMPLMSDCIVYETTYRVSYIS